MTQDPETAPRPTHVDLARSFEDSGVKDVLRELDDTLIGLEPVKSRIRETAALLLVDKARRQMGLATETPTLHMSFTGNPGTGKTTVALKMADLLHRLGYVRKGHLVTVTRDDLVGQYIGHTAPKTKEVLKKAMGGVLFIDEAYYLYRPENERDYGQEAIEILLQVMENNRDDLVVILAGYADRMDRFFASNPGFRSRIAHHIDMDPVGALVLDGPDLAPEIGEVGGQDGGCDLDAAVETHGDSYSAAWEMACPVRRSTSRPPRKTRLARRSGSVMVDRVSASSGPFA